MSPSMRQKNVAGERPPQLPAPHAPLDPGLCRERFRFRFMFRNRVMHQVVGEVHMNGVYNFNSSHLYQSNEGGHKLNCGALLFTYMYGRSWPSVVEGDASGSVPSRSGPLPHHRSPCDAFLQYLPSRRRPDLDPLPRTWPGWPTGGVVPFEIEPVLLVCNAIYSKYVQVHMLKSTIIYKRWR